jgi:trehalose synthase
LPLPPAAVDELMADGDTRWIERGAYDLVDVNPASPASRAGLPRAATLYGPIDQQLERPDSFASQLQRLLAVRQAYGIYASRQIMIPDVVSPGLVVMVHELPDARGTQVTALNFGPTPIEETIVLPQVQCGPVVDMLDEKVEGDLSETCELTIRLDSYEGRSLRIVGALPTMGPVGT